MLPKSLPSSRKSLYFLSSSPAPLPIPTIATTTAIHTALSIITRQLYHVSCLFFLLLFLIPNSVSSVIVSLNDSQLSTTPTAPTIPTPTTTTTKSLNLSSLLAFGTPVNHLSNIPNPSPPTSESDTRWWCPFNCNCLADDTALSSSTSTVQLHNQSTVHPHHQSSTNPNRQFRVDCSNRQFSAIFRSISTANVPLSSSSLSPLPPPTISTIVLSRNQITQLNQSSLISYVDLRRLLLNHNQIRQLQNYTFALLSSLEQLNLAHNQIETLEIECFQGLGQLRILDLSYNRLNQFPKSQIQPSNLGSLIELNLHQNQIQRIPERAFSPTLVLLVPNGTRNTINIKSPIVKFDLSSNPLNQFHRDAFLGMGKLRKLHLSEVSSQEQFPSFGSEPGDSSIEHIRLDRSRIDSIDPYLCRLVGATLKSLVLKSNRITTIPSLEHCIELRVLDLSNNRLTTLAENRFVGQSKLIDLIVGHNRLETLERDTFAGLQRLKVLNVENNLIGYIHSEAFLPLRALNDLNLGHNHFSQLPVLGIANITEIKVHGNRNLREFPPLESFPYVHSLALSYAYHCCSYQDRIQRHNPLVASSHNPDSPDLHDSILWLESENDNQNHQDLNTTIQELARQFWKQYTSHQQQPLLLDYSDYEAEQLAIHYGFEPSETAAAAGGAGATVSGIESSFGYPWMNLLEPNTKPESNGNGFLQPGIGVGDARSAQGPKLIQCLPTPGPFMPCKDLFDWWTLRLGVWLVFPLALVGNGMVLIVLLFGRRRRRRRKLDVTRFLVCNLSAADIFMGIYLGMLALVDASTLGHFRTYAIRWQNSWACQLTGFVGVFSAELSVYTLAVITLERNYAITHAMHLNKRLSLRAASTIMSFGWGFALMMATMPLFGISDYRKFAVCLPFETETSVWSLLYVLTLIAFNGVAFLLLMGCYLRMYCAIRGSQAWNSNDTRIAMRMALLVFTDFLCWAPIAFFTITAVAGWNLISLEEAKIFTVFVLPLNACANPFLYAFFTKQFKKECATLCKRIDAATSIGKFCARFHSNDASNPDDINNQDQSRKRIKAKEPEMVVPAGIQQRTRQELMVDCKVCGHRSQATQHLQMALPEEEEEEEEEVEENGVHSNPSLIGSNRTPKPKINLASKSLDIDINIDSNESNSNDQQECQCQHCHCNNHQDMQPKVSGLSSTSTTSSSWIASGFRHLFPNHRFSKSTETLEKNAGQARQQPSSLSNLKQFKSNSIIYQYNYRKNHIHMSLESDMIRPTPTTPVATSTAATQKQNQTKRKIKSLKKQPINVRHSSDNNLQLDSTIRKHPGTLLKRTTTSPLPTSGPRDRSDSREQSSTISAEDSSEESRRPKLSSRFNYTDEDTENNSCSSNYHGSGAATIEYYLEPVLPSNNKSSTNAMTTGIMRLKKKFIRKQPNNYCSSRKMSGDSQYEFSSYRRKDSSSTTGRLSFSSDATGTRSTSSSYLSSGVWSGGGGGGGGRATAASTSAVGGGGALINGPSFVNQTAPASALRPRFVQLEYCMALSEWQYRKLILLSSKCSQNDSAWLFNKNVPLTYDFPKEEEQEEEGQEENCFIILSLSNKELKKLLLEKHGNGPGRLYRKNIPNTKIANFVRTASKEESYDSSEELVDECHRNECLVHVLYLFTNQQPATLVGDKSKSSTFANVETTTFISDSSTSNPTKVANFNQLEVYLLLTSDSSKSMSSMMIEKRHDFNVSECDRRSYVGKNEVDDKQERLSDNLNIVNLINLCPDCTRHYLINKLLEIITIEEEEEEEDGDKNVEDCGKNKSYCRQNRRMSYVLESLKSSSKENGNRLSIHSQLLRCSIRQSSSSTIFYDDDDDDDDYENRTIPRMDDDRISEENITAISGANSSSSRSNSALGNRTISPTVSQLNTTVMVPTISTSTTTITAISKNDKIKNFLQSFLLPKSLSKSENLKRPRKKIKKFKTGGKTVGMVSEVRVTPPPPMDVTTMNRSMKRRSSSAFVIGENHPNYEDQEDEDEDSRDLRNLSPTERKSLKSLIKSSNEELRTGLCYKSCSQLQIVSNANSGYATGSAYCGSSANSSKSSSRCRSVLSDVFLFPNTGHGSGRISTDTKTTL